MNLDTVIIEVTRRCNMACAHCMRGDAENCDIDTKYIDALLSKVEYINNITFTGGEPSLVPELIQYTIDKAKELNVGFGSFYIATNGKNVPDAFIMAVMKLYIYCDEKEMCQLAISNDGYHTDEDNNKTLEENYLKLSVFRFTEKREENNGDYYNDLVLPEGRGWDYGSGKEKTIYGFDNIESDNISGMIYLNVNGNILPDCDMSYESQENPLLIIGNILDSDFDFEDYCQNFQDWLDNLDTNDFYKIIDMEETVRGKVA